MKIFVSVIVAMMCSTAYAQSASRSDKLSCSLNSVEEACVRVCLIEKDPDACSVRVSDERKRDIRNEMERTGYESSVAADIKAERAKADVDAERARIESGRQRQYEAIATENADLRKLQKCTINGVNIIYAYGKRKIKSFAVGSGYSWYDAMRFAKELNPSGHWRLPTSRELNLMIAARCDVGRNTWTSTINSGGGAYATGVLNSGEIERSYYSFEYTDCNEMYILGGDVTEFNDSYKLVADFDSKAQAQKQAQEIREREQAERARRVREEEESKIRNILTNKNPQAMYLAAGAYERSGEISRAKEVYEAIISRFPDSSWAVKSNDQLNANKRANDAESSAQQRIYDESNRCSARIRSCESSCFSLEGASYGACLKRCQSICSR